MSHSQWEKKKYKKAAESNKISKIYSKLVRLITTKAKKSAGNRESPGLKQAISKAREVDMPNDNIERAINKANESGTSMEQMMYEAYGPGGVGIIIDALTDNRNKASQEIKHILSKNGSSLASTGSVTWGFEKYQTPEGLVWKPIQTTQLSAEDSALLEKIVDELEENDEVQDIYTNQEI